MGTWQGEVGKSRRGSPSPGLGNGNWGIHMGSSLGLLGAGTAKCSQCQEGVVAVPVPWSWCPRGTSSVPRGAVLPTGTPVLLLTCLAVWLISTARSNPEFPIPMTMTLLSEKSWASL